MLTIYLLLSGDVEQNPGPLSTEQEQQMFQAVMKIPLMMQGQSDILDEIRCLRANQQAMEQKINDLSVKVQFAEETASRVTSLHATIERISCRVDSATSALASMRDSQDDLEDRSRRNNLIFVGLPDTANETWAESEEKITSFCAEKLNVSLELQSMERAHRIGRYSEHKKRPLIVKFMSFKERQRVLEAASRLKGTGFGISEDYSKKVCFERKKLLQFAKSRGSDFKLIFNKLKIGKKTYKYNADSDNVIELDG
ncbi:uncharacterized protein [Dermacentor andersoni]|uniref:uncharacterized protein n=1 Tax=Dermacentor andersoni TaxID=34620 RepID=UPI003B3B3F21